MTYDRKNYGGIQGYSQKTPRITSQQTQDNPGLEFKVNSTNELMKKTYYPNAEPVEGFAVEDSFAVSIEELGSIYNMHQLVIQFSMMLGTIGTSMPKFVQAVRVMHTRDRITTSLDTLKLTEENKQKKIAESTYTLCFFWDATLAIIAKIPKNSLVQLYFIDNKREYGIIWSSSFFQLGNFSGVPNPGFDKFNGTTLTNFGSPGGGIAMTSGGGGGGFGNCNPYTSPITPVNYIYCGTSQEPDRKIMVHPNAPVCNYTTPGFAENGFTRFGANDSIRPPKIMVTHWDVATSTKAMYDAIMARGVKMGFGVERNGMIFQFANAGQARFGSLDFGEGTVQCEVNNPIEPSEPVKAYNMRCYGNEDGERRRVLNNPKFSFPGGGGGTITTEYIYDFFDAQYFSVGALWEAISYAYGITLQLPGDNWIDWRPAGSGGPSAEAHPYSGTSDGYRTRQYIKDNYQGILFHHNVDIRNGGSNGVKGSSGKWDIVLLDRKKFLQNALAIRAQRKSDGTF